MSATQRIAIDAMGGDHGLRTTVPAALEALHLHPHLEILLVGHEAEIHRYLSEHTHAHSPELKRLTVHHAPGLVAMDEKPSQALRHKRDSSLWKTIELIRDGKADGAVSAGNTGALMVMGRYLLKTFEGIDRPAMIASIPTQKGGCYLLDVGANVDSTTEHLLQFAVMGSVMARCVDGLKNPRVALLNIGHEDIKGNEQVKQASSLLADSTALNFVGYVEADSIYSGAADVVVCDGFVGNVALKASEGTARLISARISAIFASSWYHRLLGVLGLPLVNRLKKDLDVGRFNGATFLGLSGTLVKSHGSASTRSFRYAIERCLVEAQSRLPEQICKGLAETSFD